MLIALCGGTPAAQQRLLAELRHDSPVKLDVLDLRVHPRAETRRNQLRRDVAGIHLYNRATVVLGIRTALEVACVRQLTGQVWHLYGPLTPDYNDELTIEPADVMVAPSPLDAKHPAHVHTPLEALHQCQRRARRRADQHRQTQRRADLTAAR